MLPHPVPGGRAVIRGPRASGGLPAHPRARGLHEPHPRARLGRRGRTDARLRPQAGGAGADFLICPDNTIHEALPGILARSPLPWLPIAEVVAEEAERRGYRRLGITGTRFLVASEVYPRALAASAAVPATDRGGARGSRPHHHGGAGARGVQRRRGGLSAGRHPPHGQAGCDAVVLGCTEIPLLIGDHNSSLPTLDSTRLLARAALGRAAAVSAA